MSELRIVRVYHSAVVDEYRQRERQLRAGFGHDVQLVCPPRWSEGGSLVEARPADDLPVHVIAVRGSRHPALFWYAHRRFRQVLRHVQPHVVDLHEEPYSLAVAAALRAVRAEVPSAKVCVYTAQNIYKRYPWPIRWLEARALRRADACYPCSTEAGDVLRRKDYAGPLHIIPLGTSIPAEPKRHRPGPTVVGFLGRLESYKGADIAVRSVAAARGAGLDTRLEILGAGPQKPELQSLARELAIEPQVHFAGAVSQEEALRRISTYDVVMIPSMVVPNWKEQFGRVAAQAFAAGVPVVASATGSLPEVVQEPRMLAKEGDVGDFSRKLIELLASEELRDVLGRSSRERAHSLFAWDKVAGDFDRMYRRILSGDGDDWTYVAPSPGRASNSVG